MFFVLFCVLDCVLYYSSEFKISIILTSDKLQSQALFHLSIIQSFLDNSSPSEERKIWLLVGSHTHNSIHVFPSTFPLMRFLQMLQNHSLKCLFHFSFLHSVESTIYLCPH